MAENKQEKRTIKVGSKEFLEDDFLGAVAKYLPDYMRFAREQGGYDDAGASSLLNYINNKTNQIKTGKGLNADGSFDDDVVENVTMKVKKPKGLGKTEITQGNRDWANNFFYHISQNIKPYEAEPEKTPENVWDATKHGLGAYLTGQGLNGKDIFEKYDLKDANNPDAARSFNQRRELLKQHLAGYGEWLKNKGFDFSKNDNEWDDNYVADFDKFVADFDSLDNTALCISCWHIFHNLYETEVYPVSSFVLILKTSDVCVFVESNESK